MLSEFRLYTAHTVSSECTKRGRELPDAMSLRYADTSLPDLLGRPSLRYAVTSLRHADRYFAMQTKPPLCSKRAFTIQKYFLKLLFRMHNKMFLTILST